MTDAQYQPFPLPTSARAQVWRYSPAYRRPRHFHSEPELNLVCAGHGKFAFGDRITSVCTGDLLWWPPGQDHELIEASADFDLYVIGMTPALSERVLARAAGIVPPTGRARLEPGALARLRSACSAPLAELEPAVVENHVGALWRAAHAMRSDNAGPHVLTRRTLAQLLEDSEVDRGALARAFRVDRSDISRYFKRDTGLTLTAYRTRLRLLSFVRAVDAGASLLAAASIAGFGSYSQCHRAFSAVFGCAPRTFFRTSRRTQMAERFEPW